MIKINNNCCGECHSNHYIQNGFTDELMDDFKPLSTKEKIDIGAVFTCHLNRRCFCKGICQIMDVTEQELNTLCDIEEINPLRIKIKTEKLVTE